MLDHDTNDDAPTAAPAVPPPHVPVHFLHLDPAQYAYISSVYVIPKARERGVLRTLLSAADAWCAERGLDEMRLHNAADNPLANAAWEALGFEVVERLRVRSLRRR